MTLSITTPIAIRSKAGAHASQELAIDASGLVKRFGDVAVDGLDLRVGRGGVYGLLGPNGAGKTTVIRILATLLRADAGTARVLGHDVARDGDAVRRCISLTGQYASVDENLTGAREPPATLQPTRILPEERHHAPTTPISSDGLHAALAASARPSRPSSFSACLGFGWRGMLKIKHVPGS